MHHSLICKMVCSSYIWYVVHIFIFLLNQLIQIKNLSTVFGTQYSIDVGNVYFSLQNSTDNWTGHVVMAWATKTTLVEDITMDHRATKTEIKSFFTMEHSSGCRVISESDVTKGAWMYVSWHCCSWRGYLVIQLVVIMFAESRNKLSSEWC